MSITLLEITVIIILVVVSWQIGVAITPWIFEKIRGVKYDLDEIADEIAPSRGEEIPPKQKDESSSNHKYRNN